MSNRSILPLYSPAPHYPSAAFLRSCSTLPPSYHPHDPNPQVAMALAQVPPAVVHELRAMMPPSPSPSPSPAPRPSPPRAQSDSPFNIEARAIIARDNAAIRRAKRQNKAIAGALVGTGAAMIIIGVCLYFWRQSQGE